MTSKQRCYTENQKTENDVTAAPKEIDSFFKACYQNEDWALNDNDVWSATSTK